MNNFNALRKSNFKNKLYISNTNVEKVLKLPKKPITRNNISWSDNLRELNLDRLERNKPRKKEAKVLIMRMIVSLFKFIFSSFL